MRNRLSAQGIVVRQADYEDPASLESAFKGIERLLLISTMGANETRIRQHLNAVGAAKKAGVKFIVYASAAKADTTSLWLAEVHRTTEIAILAGASLVTSAGDGRVSWAPRADYAQAAAAALSKVAIRNRTLEVESRDFEALLGRPVTPLNEAVDAFVQGLKVAA